MAKGSVVRMLLGLVAGASLAGAVAAPARADVIVLTFEGVGDGASINNFYNGGTDSAGHSGTNFGISFTSDSVGLISQGNGGMGSFQGNPSGSTIAFFLSGDGETRDTINVAAGFTTGFSFFYSSSTVGRVNVFSGLNGTGNLLAQVSITAILKPPARRTHKRTSALGPKPVRPSTARQSPSLSAGSSRTTPGSTT